MSRRDEILHSAVDVLGANGLHGLTHRKVDRAAGLPEGTTSNYFRTRSRLLAGVVEHLVGTETGVWRSEAITEVDTEQALVDGCVAFVSWAVGPGRGRSLAQIALLESAVVEPEVSTILSGARARIEEEASVICARLGLDHTATAILLDATDAVIFRQLAIGDAAFEPRPYFARLIRGLLVSRT